MADKKFPQSGLPLRQAVDLLPTVFRTDTNDKFLSGVVDPLIQPGVLQKNVGYVGRRYGKTYRGKDVYLDSDNTLRSRYQLEPGVVSKENGKIDSFYDYLDFKNQIKFFGNTEERDALVTSQTHYSWNPPIDWDKFVNYREYYWIPEGPPAVSVSGQAASVISSYKVSLGLNSFVFTPDGATNNPALILYRGQTYKFNVDVPNEGFVIRTGYDTGSLMFNETLTYTAGQVVVYDNKLWRAKKTILPLDGSTIDLNSENWEFIENVSASATALDYNIGVTNNGIQKGTVTFKVPYDSPDILFYQSIVDPNKFGRFIIANIESNTSINVTKEILGKSQYTSSNGITFTNGLVVEFLGKVVPSKYANETWLVEGVGKEITLTKFSELVVPVLISEAPEVSFDNEGFDTQPFDDAAAYPGQKDYLTINRSSVDRNPWSRYNRWFHKSVLEYAFNQRGQDFPATETARAKRPIIEFISNIQLFNHGSIAKDDVDYIDDFTSDVFSTIEGSTGYNIDGEELFDGARILVVGDTDTLANNKIYVVTFITHNNRRQISLKESTDSETVIGNGVLVRRGTKNAGYMFHFNGTAWKKSQVKNTVQQAPLFDAFDSDEVSFSDQDLYPVSTFLGTKLFSYKIGNSIADSQLGFSISHLNIDNVGDILFNWDWEIDSFLYNQGQTVLSKYISVGYYKINVINEYSNGWIPLDGTYVQPLVDSTVIETATNKITTTIIDWSQVTDDSAIDINFYLNGTKINDSYVRSGGIFTFNNITFAEADVVSIKLITDLEPHTGYYEIPVGLEKNPLNEKLESFTLGQAIDHINSAVEFDNRLSGVIPGSSNLRDLDQYQKYAKRFLRHSGLAPISISLLCDKQNNIVKAIQYAKKSYTDFKNNFIARATEIDFNDVVPDMVDDIINDLTKTKTTSSPFSDSDMIGSGAYTSIDYIVEDTGITTYALSEKFSLNELSRRAVYVYVNDVQKLHGRDYKFNDTFGFVILTSSTVLVEGDKLQIREYVSTASNHIPPTPTSLGMYKKYTPSMFLDDTYVEPKLVIQGHDGSITPAYRDFRDDLLLELEYRIYNNIKQEYDTGIFDIDSMVGGYNGYGTYKKSQLDSVVIQEFLKWIRNTNINYTENTYFDSENSFTYTYSNMTDPTGTENLPGWWRGVYQYFYDTDRPHRCPWEMLGFSEKPDWWDAEYGAAPYTRGNLLLWEDLRDGIIKRGTNAGTYDRYKRPTILSHIPVDGDGKLLSPLDSGLAGNFTLVNNKGSFVLGDVSPVEYGWRSSSEWPFAVSMAMCLMKPFEFISDNFDRSQTVVNKIGQIVDSTTNQFQTLDRINIPDSGGKQATGLVLYLVSYAKSKGLTVASVQAKIENLDVALSSRLSGFVDKTNQKYLLDSKSPKSTSSSVYVPPENYDIIFNVSSPISSIAYSGIILEKTEGGWILTGYDDIHPYFNYFDALVNQRDPIISVGGVSEGFLYWTTNKTYNNGQVVSYGNDYYRSIKTHNSGDFFDTTMWQKLGKLPIVGAVEASYRRNFNTLKVKQISYGTKLPSIQAVVDFLLGYQKYLQSVGFIFDRYDTVTQSPQDWLTSAKEFMFWTKHSWSIGSLLTLSPAAEKLNVNISIGVADNILDGFYDYQVLRADGQTLNSKFINVNRTFQNVTIETTNTTEGIYYLKLYFVLKEHVSVFSDRTVFNDIIYDKITGYRQERIKTQGFRTVDWDGDYTSPGFLFDNVNIQVWQPFTDYKLGDIVSYKSYNWTSLINQLGSETFNNDYWSKLDSTPEKQLISNFDYKINQIEDYYNVSSGGIGEDQRSLARHAIGYQTREYLQNLAEDPITQFQLYQGFVREKGTSNAITKIFNKLSRADDASIVLNEEWAFRVGQVGGIDQLKEIEFEVSKSKFALNPQLMLIVPSVGGTTTDQYYRLTESNFTIKDLPFDTNVNPTSYDAEPNRTSGYVKSDHVAFSVATRDSILALDIVNFTENDHVWVTFDTPSWSVLRFNESPLLLVTAVSKVLTTVEITLSRRHSLQVDDIIGIKNVINLTGFFKITAVTSNTVSVEVSATAQEPGFDSSTIINLHTFTDCRFESYQAINPEAGALLKNNSRMWVDNAGADLWEVVEKKKQFSNRLISDYGITAPLSTGTAVVYISALKQTIVSMPKSGYVMSYIESDTGLSLKQIIPPPAGFETNVIGSFGMKLAVSPDNRFLVIASPLASGIRNNYKGIYNPGTTYLAGDIVEYSGKLWKALEDTTFNLSPVYLSSIVPGRYYKIVSLGSTSQSKWNQAAGTSGKTYVEGQSFKAVAAVTVLPGTGYVIQLNDSTIDIASQKWAAAESIPATPVGRSDGFTEQGMISIYEYSDQQWVIRDSFVSPRPEANERFGSAIAIGQSSLDYYLAVSAIGSYHTTGRVYLYNYLGTQNAQEVVVTFSGSQIQHGVSYDAVVFTEPHGLYQGQAMSYQNGTLSGQFVSTATSPPPPDIGTVFYVVRWSATVISLAATAYDAIHPTEAVAAGRLIDLTDIGIDDSSYHTLISTSVPPAWRHIENQNYMGVYDNTGSVKYPAGAIVWHNSSLWQAQNDTTGDGSTININSNEWKQLDPVATQCSLPQVLSLEDDGSTLLQLSAGLLDPSQLAEQVKQGDEFGFSLAMNRDGSILAVGVPNSDGQYFNNYRGLWRPDVEYVEGDTVKYQDFYHTLVQRTAEIPDSTTRSYNEMPDAGLPWQNVGDSTSTASGKVFVYQRSSYGTYDLKQTINNGALSDISDLGTSENISSGDQFGWALDLDYSGSTLAVTSPKADINFQNQGSAYVFRTDGYADLSYRLKQKLESFEIYPNEYFGQSISVSANTEKIVIGAKNTPFALSCRLDTTLGTYFDNGKTRFIDRQGFAGAVYVFEIKDSVYFLTEKLETELSPFESFGYSVDCTDSVIVVGSPDYQTPVSNSTGVSYTDGKVGNVRLFKKDTGVESWETIAEQKPVVDISKIKSVSLYDNIKNEKIQDIDYIDPAKLKILNSAETEIKFKTPYDPAVYTIGTDSQVVEPTQAWAEKNVGQLWWDISTAKWNYYEQGTQAYRTGNWGVLAEGASIDIYEWIETPLLPNEWSALADTNEGIVEGISGQPLHPNNDVYTVKVLYNAVTGQPTSTLYYYWVKNKVIVPTSADNRSISAASVASLISNPSGSGIAFIAFIDTDKFLAYNFPNVLSDTALINIEYKKNNKPLNLVHNEYQLLTEGVADSLPSAKLENKWLDSLVGYDTAGNRVPDPALPAKQKYGLLFRPRQSMFVDRLPILKTVVGKINTVLLEEPFADTISFENLNLVDSQPNSLLNLYDIEVDTYIDLTTVGTNRIKQAKLRANIVDGQIDTIDIVDAGFGYKPKELFNQEVPNVYKGPPIVVSGDGVNASAICHMDGQGRITAVSITNRGRNYTTATATVRNFSVLVNIDSTANNFWSIYAWDDVRGVFFRSKSQAYDTTKYWELTDWWKSGYSITSRIIKEIANVTEEETITVLLGDLIKIKEYGTGGWAIFQKTSETGATFIDRYSMVAREKGTINIKSTLYQTASAGIGYDTAQSFDTGFYDIENSKEMRNIFAAVKNDIFVGEYAVEWNNLFFSSIRYVFAEQQYVDWAFKTSFLNAVHNVGPLVEKLNYKNDNLLSFQEYINEVKPYRTTVREYVSRYNTIEPTNTAVGDFDLPPTYSTVDGKVVPVTSRNDIIGNYPWKLWSDNHGYSVTSIELFSKGEDYNAPPTVIITSVDGNGKGATAQAFISNGFVSGIKVLTPGAGYTVAPTITLVGGNSSGSATAMAVAIIGDSKARTFSLSMKLDRITKDGLYSSFTQSQRFVATGATGSFTLSYAPNRNKSKITVIKNNRILLGSEYSISLYTEMSDTYRQLKGKLILVDAPAKNDVIEITYEKNDSLLDSVNRIQKFYNPSSSMIGNDLSQLMTGIDFGGVQIQGTTFDVTGGWDALPWFTDSWDSVESSSDFYYVMDIDSSADSTTAYKKGSVIKYSNRLYRAIKKTADSAGNVILPLTENNWQDYWEDFNIVLPYTPPEGQQITVYIKRVGQLSAVRIDDPNYQQTEWDSSSAINPYAEMPTFIANGTSNIIEITQYVELNNGDTLIFRPLESDGSVTILDPNLLDTRLSGGTLSAIQGAYQTANGLSAEDIVVDGDKFVSPDQVPAPEENVPGQVLDSVSIKVFHSTRFGVAPLQSRIAVASGGKIFSIGLNVLESQSVLVYVDKVKRNTGTDPLDYSVNLRTLSVEFVTAPTAGSIVEIISIGVGGVSLLDYQEFEADGETGLFLTKANYADTSSIFVTVNGEYQDIGFIDSTGVIDTEGKVLVQFGIKPNNRDIIKIISLGSSGNTDTSSIPIVRVNQQSFTYRGTERRFGLDNFVTLATASAVESMIVQINNVALIGVDTLYSTYDGTVNEFVLGLDPVEPPGTILPTNIFVYVNDELRTFVQDYVYDGTTKVLTIEPSILNHGDIIKITNNFRTQYYVDGNDIVIDDSISLTTGDDVQVTWFGEYPSMKIVSDEFTGGKVQYQLAHEPVNISYVWVYKNGNRLTQDLDYSVSLPRSVVYLKDTTTVNDKIKIVLFGSEIYRAPSGYEIFKDMLNIYQYKRYSINEVSLAQPLNYYDTSMVVNNAAELPDPIPSRNIPGIISIAGEKIEYMSKVDNTLSQLRRGVAGTPIGNSYNTGTLIANSSSSEVIPYNENQERTDFVSDGSSLLIGPLDFIPQKRIDSLGATVEFTYTDTIPEGFYPCDTVEVFVAGKRLFKDPISIYNQTLGAASPAADEVREADFSVDGSTNYIRLTNKFDAGTRITIIRKTGRVWYNLGTDTTLTGVTLLENTTPQAIFIAQRTTKLPE
jgi:hypothetical protein